MPAPRIPQMGYFSDLWGSCDHHSQFGRGVRPSPAGAYNAAMANTDAGPPRPIGLLPLLGLTLGVFLVGLLVAELVDPRFTAQRRAPTVGPVSAVREPARPVPTLRPRSSAAVPSPRVAATPAPDQAVTAPPAERDEPGPELPQPGDESAGAPLVVVVSGTGGLGARLRAEPGPAGAILRVLDEGTQLLVRGEETSVDGRRWIAVQAADGQSGWVAADLLEVISPGP